MAPMSGRAVSPWATVKPVVVRPAKRSESQKNTLFLGENTGKWPHLPDALASIREYGLLRSSYLDVVFTSGSSDLAA